MSWEQPEPTDDDYCLMAGHPLSHMDEENGWDRCYCGDVIDLPEPHDEHSATVANLCDEYIRILHGAQNKDRSNSDIHEDHHHAYTVLKRMDITFLQQLIQSARNSFPEHIKRTKETQYATVVMLGVHLDYSGMSAVRTVCNKLRGDAPPINSYTVSLHDAIKDPEEIHAARTAAKLYSLLRNTHQSSVTPGSWNREAVDFVTDAALLLLDRPEKVADVAAIFNANPYHEKALQLATAIVGGHLESPPQSLLDGLL